MWTETPASYEGKHYRIHDAYCEPKPDPVPPILIGGGGEQLTLRAVARYADWWNIPGGTLDNYRHKLDVLREHCQAVGRNYDEIVKTWSAEVVALGETEAEARRILDASPYSQPEPIMGTPQQVAEQLGGFVEAGVSYIIVRCVDFPNTAGIELFMQDVMPLLREAA
jgi:alkanesulfonate monooxygenase SsuD/methylene tetrahydromethanopterin reductase-like flavin-dependent oxidoreductase (luciferase family)